MNKYEITIVEPSFTDGTWSGKGHRPISWVESDQELQEEATRLHTEFPGREFMYRRTCSFLRHKLESPNYKACT